MALNKMQIRSIAGLVLRGMCVTVRDADEGLRVIEECQQRGHYPSVRYDGDVQISSGLQRPATRPKPVPGTAQASEEAGQP